MVHINAADLKELLLSPHKDLPGMEKPELYKVGATNGLSCILYRVRLVAYLLYGFLTKYLWFADRAGSGGPF